MELVYKKLADDRSLYIYFPAGKARTVLKTSLLTVLREESDEESVRALLESEGLQKLAEEKRVIIAFPNPVNGGWNWEMDPEKQDDVAFLAGIVEEVKSDKPPVMDPHAPPSQSFNLLALLEKMRDTWHAMDDTRYYAGFGSGASMAVTLAALEPTLAAGIYAVGGKLAPKAVAASKWAAMPAFLTDCDEKVFHYFQKVNGAMCVGTENGYTKWENDRNPNQRMFTGSGKITTAEVYDMLFCAVRRPNVGTYGDIERRLVSMTDYVNFEIHEDEKILSDGIAHTWMTHVPTCVKANPEKKVPLLLFFHGATDCPAEAAEMSKFHELGERDGFITVYPWSTDLMTWNVEYDPNKCDDDGYTMALMDYMIANYPVDTTRIYVSGFSNGAAMAQVMGLCHPDRIAAVCPIDSNWPGDRNGETLLHWSDVPAMKKAMAFKQEKGIDYRLPNWYTYGNREPSYPVFRNCTQQNQYDFWKLYNNITIKETPTFDAPHPSGVGVPGDEYAHLMPSANHEHHYDLHRFRSNDEGNPILFNYCVMLNKGHDIAQMDAAMGWNFVKQFRRNPDGSLTTEE